MAQKGIKNAVSEGKLDLTNWAENMKKRLEANYEKQNVWPRGYPGPYIGYRNTKSAKKSTGQSIRRFVSQVWAGANGDTEKISFFFYEYLYFVDMGVGRGQPIETVERSMPANWKKLYQEWEGEGDRQSRPVLTMELRHQCRRLETLVSSFYQDYVQVVMVEDPGKDGTIGARGKISYK